MFYLYVNYIRVCHENWEPIYDFEKWKRDNNGQRIAHFNSLNRYGHLSSSIHLTFDQVADLAGLGKIEHNISQKQMKIFKMAIDAFINPNDYPARMFDY